MAHSPEIRIAKIQYGPLPGAPWLNPKISPHQPLLLATLDIRWEPEAPRSAVARLEDNLLTFSPDLAKHECRGEGAYRVFTARNSEIPDRSAAVEWADPAPAGGEPYDGRLALAHLLEHAVIDFQCAITDAERCSGITAAHRSTSGRFDLMVECQEERIGRCCLALAVAWLTRAANGESLGTAEREVLIAARVFHGQDGRGLRAPVVARKLAWSEDRARRALTALRQVGYLDEVRSGVGSCDVPEYRLARA